MKSPPETPSGAPGWEGAALSALAGGITGGLNANTQLFNLTSSPAVNTALRMATANALTQGIGVATGLQKKFDWKGVAASAAGGFAGAAVGARLPEGLDPFLGKIVTGFAAGTAAAVARGGRVAIQQVAVDAFGNALGSSLAEAASGDPTRDPTGKFYENEMDRQSDVAYTQRQRDAMYGLASASNAPYARLGEPSGTGVAEWSSGVDRAISRSAAEQADIEQRLADLAPPPLGSAPGILLADSSGNSPFTPGKGASAMYNELAVQNYNDAKLLYNISAGLQKTNPDFAKTYRIRADEAMAGGDAARELAKSVYTYNEPMWKNAPTQTTSFPSGWSHMGQNSVGYVQGRGIFPDYQSAGISSHTMSGSVAMNLYDGTSFYGGGVSKTNVNPGFQPSLSYGFGWIFGVNSAEGVNDFLGGSGTQVGIAIPTPWKVSPSIVINHSYGGATSIELGVGPRVNNSVFVYQPYGYSEKVGK